VSRPVPDTARTLAAQLDALFGQDAEIARRLSAAQRQLQAANDRLWWGLHPDGLAAVYGEDPAAVEVAFAENRSEVLGAPDPLLAAQHVHWTIHRAFIDYQTAAEDRRQLAADIGEVIRRFVDVRGRGLVRTAGPRHQRPRARRLEHRAVEVIATSNRLSSSHAGGSCCGKDRCEDQPNRER
jgi:hypothetical protein